MTEDDPNRERDRHYVPTPEELEAGLGSGRGKRRRGGSKRGLGRKQTRARRARGLFRLLRGVGRKRTEAVAPSPTQPRPRSSPSVPPEDRLDDPGKGPPPPTAPVRKQVPPSEVPRARSKRVVKGVDGGGPPSTTTSRQRVRQVHSPEPKPPSVGTPARRAGEPADRGGRSLSAASGQRVRRVRLPERKPPPVKKPHGPVPKDKLKKLAELGHSVGQFEEIRTHTLQENRYQAKCRVCGLKAIARHAAPDGWALQDAGNWDLQGKASETSCSTDGR